MILVDEASRQRIEMVIEELLETSLFESVFRCVEGDDEGREAV